MNDAETAAQAVTAAEAAAVRTGDEATFTHLVEHHRRELQVHCYRMVGSFEDAEDLVQETFLRAWRRRETFAGRASVRAWLYRIATNACLDFLDAHPRRATPRDPDSALASSVTVATPPPATPWLQPYPDVLLEPAAPADDEPDALVVARETIELAFLAAIQHLPPRQRAVLILRDVLGWPASETATLVETSVASVKSALQRARATMKETLPSRRDAWSAASAPTDEERRLLDRYVDAHQRADLDAVAALLAEDVQQTMPPLPVWISGRAALLGFTAEVFDPDSERFHGRWLCVPTSANRQPAVALYAKLASAETTRDARTAEGNSSHRFHAQVLDVLRVVDGRVAEIVSFEPHLFPAFGLPLSTDG